MKLLTQGLSLMLLLCPMAAQASEAAAETQEEKEAFKRMSYEELSARIAKKDPKLALFDSNSPEMRKQLGMIPTAKPLSSYREYDVAKELPKQKDVSLVFYCANQH